MSEFLTAAQMRAVEEAEIAAGRVTGFDLMEAAGRAVAQAIAARRPVPGHARVLSGPGNNGGDGFAIARHLHGQGWHLRVEFWGNAARLPADARRMHDLWAELGPVWPLSAPQGAEVVVDALFGTGLTRPLPDAVAAALGAVEGAFVVAVDIPSGLEADGGRVLGHALAADLTVTFHRPKLGHVLGAGPGLCGEVVVADIGLERRGAAIPADVVREVAPLARALQKPQGHKFDHGHALVLSGGAGQGGAARLAARGALRAGAGVVTLGCPSAALTENAARLDAVMLRVVEDAAALAPALADPRLSALCLGPALGLDGRAAALVGAALTQDPRPAAGLSPRVRVLDADALTLIAGNAELRAALGPACILTPHPGEFARLFPELGGHGAVAAARAAAARSGAVVLLKGPATVIAAPDGTCRINAALGARAVPWLATAGAGDVLAGIIAGLAARGIAPFDAACQGAWLHSEAALEFGPGLIAEDLPEALPAVFRRLAGRA